MGTYAQMLQIYILGSLGDFSRLGLCSCSHKFKFHWKGLGKGIWDSKCDSWTGNHYLNESEGKGAAPTPHPAAAVIRVECSRTNSPAFQELFSRKKRHQSNSGPVCTEDRGTKGLELRPSEENKPKFRKLSRKLQRSHGKD